MKYAHSALPEYFPESVAESFGQDAFGIWQGFYIGDIEIRFRWIPPGEFLMGSPEGEAERFDEEGPQHRVEFRQGYWLAETACTQALWEAVMSNNPSRFGGKPENPVENLSWKRVQEFIARLNSEGGEPGYRLPSEAEWEYACRAGTESAFWFGEKLSSDDANYNGKISYAGGRKGEYRQTTVGVKHFKRNPWGLYQMHGNVWEWCEDAWHGNYQGAPVDGSAWDSAESRKRAVCRGGSWFGYGRRLRSASRNRGAFGVAFVHYGFRLARGPESSSPASAGRQRGRKSEGRVMQPRRRPVQWQGSIEEQVASQIHADNCVELLRTAVGFLFGIVAPDSLLSRHVQTFAQPARDAMEAAKTDEFAISYEYDDVVDYKAGGSTTILAQGVSGPDGFHDYQFNNCHVGKGMANGHARLEWGHGGREGNLKEYDVKFENVETSFGRGSVEARGRVEWEGEIGVGFTYDFQRYVEKTPAVRLFVTGNGAYGDHPVLANHSPDQLTSQGDDSYDSVETVESELTMQLVSYTDDTVVDFDVVASGFEVKVSSMDPVKGTIRLTANDGSSLLASASDISGMIDLKLTDAAGHQLQRAVSWAEIKQLKPGM